MGQEALSEIPEELGFEVTESTLEIYKSIKNFDLPGIEDWSADLEMADIERDLGLLRDD